MAPAATILDGQSDNNKKYGGLGKSKDGRTFAVRSYPTFETLEEERQYRKEHLAAAFRVFADHGYVEGITGHMYALFLSFFLPFSTSPPLKLTQYRIVPSATPSCLTTSG